MNALNFPHGPLAWREFGTPDGWPVLFLHGWPSSGWQGQLLHHAAAKTRIRLLCPDRPGIGESAFIENRHLLEWPEMARRLITSLDIQTCGVVGVSGGCPYALACAWAMPKRFTAVATVSGAPEVARLTPAERALLHPVFRSLLRLRERSPETVRIGMQLARPFLRIPLPHAIGKLALAALPGPDAQCLRGYEQFTSSHLNFRQSWAAHPDGVFTDGEIHAHPWGFDPAEIRIPADIWHGTHDAHFHHTLAAALAARIPAANYHLVENEAHFSLPLRHGAEIFQTLRQRAGMK